MKRIPSAAHARRFASMLSLGLGLTVVFTGLTAATRDTYYVNDHLATTVATVDAAGEIAALEADAFGTPTGHADEPDRFTGKPYDNDLGAYVFPFRNYRTAESHWTSGDPSGYPDGPNGRMYHATPTTSIDPLGLVSVNVTTSYAPAAQINSTNPGSIAYFQWNITQTQGTTGRISGNNSDGWSVSAIKGFQYAFNGTMWLPTVGSTLYGGTVNSSIPRHDKDS